MSSVRCTAAPATPCPRGRPESYGAPFRTPAGTDTLRVTARPAAGEVAAQAWGEGADWILKRLPTLLGGNDSPEQLVLPPGALHEAQRRNPGLRLCATGLVLDSLVPAIMEQKITVTEARRGMRYLVRRHGTPAPGPHPGRPVPGHPSRCCRPGGWAPRAGPTGE
ncbi:hypothetical protein [Kitasatospora sp. NPDC051705]|uniref:hypothetical protein n=1 Tax=Kitasatospora sp. NPDC051705 TaxID=3364057 RepID=UPI00378D0392